MQEIHCRSDELTCYFSFLQVPFNKNVFSAKKREKNLSRFCFIKKEPTDGEKLRFSFQGKLTSRSSEVAFCVLL